MGQLSGIEHVFIKNNRIGIGIGNTPAVLSQGFAYDFFRWIIIVMGLIRRPLGDLPVLAELAVKVTAGRGQGESGGVRDHVKQRFFFDGIDMDGTRVAIDESLETSVKIEADTAVATLTVLKPASSGAQLTFYDGRHKLVS